jgi:NADPH-ferrihemoprotein reductase
VELTHAQQSYKESLGENLTIFNAFSRDPANSGRKVYVQHLIQQNAKLVNDLLVKKANFYVCGDAAHMAREVNDVLGQVVAKERGVEAKRGEEVVKNMRSMGSYQEDVWS